METKLVFALCALLATNLGWAQHDHDPTSPSTSVNNTEGAPVATGASSLKVTSPPVPALNGSDTNPSNNGTSSLNSNTTAGGVTASLTPKSTEDNDTKIPLPDINRNLTDKLTTQLPQSSFKSQTTASHTLPTSTLTSPPHTAHVAPVNTTHTTVATSTATSISQHPIQPKTNSSASAPNQTEPAQPETTTNATASTRSSSSASASSASSPQQVPSSKTQTHTSSPVSQSDTTQAQTKPTVSTPSSPSAHTRAHAHMPSQLNVGGEGESTMVHESPTLDPLLAGLVSAFIITAVIITLLLFLKLRRRDNRPGFRRLQDLQDLPMDDMMEDTPLSMYTY